MSSLMPKLIVGVGASAGGLEALEQFFGGISKGTNSAFIVVQHLSPDYESRMEELLGRKTALNVTTAKNGQILESDTVYLLPPKMGIKVAGGSLVLTDRKKSASPPLPINDFLSSLSVEFGARAVAVVLSGTGSDGSRGLAAVHQSGGITLVQDPAIAKFDGMPMAAIDTGEVDLILGAEEMWPSIARYRDGESKQALSEEQSRDFDDDKALQQILELLRFEHEIDFKLYKPATVRRRIRRRIDLLKLEMGPYIDLLSSDREEVLALYNDLLIGVTEFFRDGPAFEVIERTVVPEIIRAHDSGKEGIRVWVAGCASGEEAYSLAILFEEAMAKRERIPVKIFATDVHRTSLETAGLGIYRKESLNKISDERRNLFFRETQEGNFRVNDSLRKMVVFAHHDIIKSAPFTRLDLVTCRNLLIYLRPNVQVRALSLMHFGLRKDGFLFSGSSESLGDLDPEFLTIDRQWKVYQKKREVRLKGPGFSPEVPILEAPTPSIPVLERNHSMPQSVENLSLQDLISIYDAVLEENMPPSCLVNSVGDLIHTFPGIQKFLDIRAGRPSSNITDQVCEDLRSTLKSALFRVERSENPVEYSGIPVVLKDGSTLRVKLSLFPYNIQGVRALNSRYFLIQIKEEEWRAKQIEGSAQPVYVHAYENDNLREDHLSELENELRQTRENLSATVEELEAANEELQATNEELLASNEEIQSTNEELHSVNEEIHTVNAELRRKITEVTEISADLEALFISTDVGVVFLDKTLHIRRFTPRMGEIFHLVPSDMGRLLSDLSHSLDDSKFLDDALAVLESSNVIEREITTLSGAPYLLRLLPYLINDEAQGVVLVLIDLSAIHDAKKITRIVRNARAAIISINLRGIIETWNDGASQIFGYLPKAAIGKDIRDIIAVDDTNRQFASSWAASGNGPVTFDAVRKDNEGNQFRLRMALSPITDDDGRRTGTSAFITKVEN